MLETGQACFTFLDMWQSGTAHHVEGDLTPRDDEPARAENVAETHKTKVWVEMVADSTSVADIDGPAYSLVQHDPPWGTDDVELGGPASAPGQTAPPDAVSLAARDDVRLHVAVFAFDLSPLGETPCEPLYDTLNYCYR